MKLYLCSLRHIYYDCPLYVDADCYYSGQQILLIRPSQVDDLFFVLTLDENSQCQWWYLAGHEPVLFDDVTA